MKKLIQITLISLIATFYVQSVSAQSPRAGIKGGVNFSNLFIDDVDDENMRIGFHAGFYSQFLNETETFGIQPELLLSTKGAKGTYNSFGLDGEVKFNLMYLDVPLPLVFKVGDQVDIHFGPYISYLLGASTSTEGDLGDGEEELDRDNFHSFDYGLTGGLALNFDVISVGVRYNYGLQQIANSDESEFFLDNSKNANGQIFAAFNFR